MRHHNHFRRERSLADTPSAQHGGNYAGHHGGSDHPGRSFGQLRFARDPVEMGDRFGGRHRHSSGGGRRRVFDHGDLRFILLSMIAARPAHGYDLIKALEERMGGGYSPSPGVIYPTLTMLEEQGFARAMAEDGKKLYRATDEGEAFLKANQASLDVIQTRIDGIARERSMVLDPRIIRAIENLKTALRLRLAGLPITDEQVRAIAAAIDAAASEAERA
jgi:DNA-binding PadR family transcriptional regulator